MKRVGDGESIRKRRGCIDDRHRYHMCMCYIGVTYPQLSGCIRGDSGLDTLYSLACGYGRLSMLAPDIVGMTALYTITRTVCVTMGPYAHEWRLHSLDSVIPHSTVVTNTIFEVSLSRHDALNPYAVLWGEDVEIGVTRPDGCFTVWSRTNGVDSRCEHPVPQKYAGRSLDETAVCMFGQLYLNALDGIMPNDF